MDPYKVLGILPHSSDSEIKEAYSNLMNTYNLDDLQDDSVKLMYEEKINEANEALRVITDNRTLEKVRDLIESDDFIAAEANLNLISDSHSAEWNYLKGILLIKKGWIDSGVNHIKRAANINPYNDEYITTIQKLNQKLVPLKNNHQRQTQNNSSLCSNNNSGNKGGLC
ncbi:MAG: J domain-containing protein [Clostridium sp.]|uniref:J domain-containing protein n=1 Tax=Clostridium sp. DSM 8431 TaxID=1761781 RepID=UPI0008F0B699|nr:J domain-containing protein [Clostridium sp. DSM 8431]MCR4943810.1 J domain-containing protein [Clostridium sp.]SFU38511.1 DnaJ domain-containing protein [Clostridium sp. DSM 8431]